MAPTLAYLSQLILYCVYSYVRDKCLKLAISNLLINQPCNKYVYMDDIIYSWWWYWQRGLLWYQLCRPCLGWGLLSQFSPFRYFPHFPLLSKQKLAIEYHVYIWQVSPQLSCGDTCQIWMWFRESNRYFCEIENLAYGEISERSFSNPHPSTVWCQYWRQRVGILTILSFQYKYNRLWVLQCLRHDKSGSFHICIYIYLVKHSG